MKVIQYAAIACMGFAAPLAANAQDAFGTGVAGASAGAASQAGAQSGAIGAIIQGAPQLNIAGAPATTAAYQDYNANIRNVPNVIAPNVYPTANCLNAASIGVGVVGVGVTGGTGFEVMNCNLRETARIVAALPANDTPRVKQAMALLCMQDFLVNTPLCVQPGQQPAAAQKTSAADPRKEQATRDADREKQVLPQTVWSDLGPENCNQNGRLIADSNGKMWTCTNKGWTQARY